MDGDLLLGGQRSAERLVQRVVGPDVPGVMIEQVQGDPGEANIAGLAQTVLPVGCCRHTSSLFV
ncbi:hypothetical protein AAH991_39935 [Microbispora sp. ZYX-F-249]|uniref:Uncharacterized protein n=1 Tax=Microbispora maris TaxID=3144104 RepID=A0ABV0B1B8_9ACTN